MLKTATPPTKSVETLDRPGWIPPDWGHNWDTNPYTYQTEEELMPAGGLHGQLLGYLMELLRHNLAQRNLMLLLDTFLLYRDNQAIKQRIGPDLLLMPYRYPPSSAYDLDQEPPPPAVVEVTSPKSHATDLEEKVSFYLGLGIATYLVIDAITPANELRQQIELHVWRMVQGQPQEMAPDAQGWFLLPEMGLTLMSQGQQLTFMDTVTGEVLFDVGQLLTALTEERLEAEQVRQTLEAKHAKEHQARLAAERVRQTLEAKHAKEHQARLAAEKLQQAIEAENMRLRSELRKLQGGESQER